MTEHKLRPKYEEFLDVIREQTKEYNSLHYVLQAMKNVIEPQIEGMTKPQLVEAFAEAIYSIYCTESWLNTKDVNIEHFKNEYRIWKITAGHLQNALEIAPGKARSETARKGALARYENDPKQKALQEIESEFLKRIELFKRHGYTAKFVREMLGKYPIIESPKTVENLVSKLKKKISQ